MKKIIILMLVFICLFSCNIDGGKSNTNNNNGSEKENIDYTTAEKLAGKTFSYFTQDVEAGDEAVLFKKSIRFGEIDKISNTIALEIKDFKGNEKTSAYDIKTNSIEGKVLDVSGLDKVREFDKEFVLDGLAYENCDENMKWAKLLEGNTYEWTALNLYKFDFSLISNNKIEITTYKSTNPDIIYYYDIIENETIQKSTETAEPKIQKIMNITENSFILSGGSEDGNGSKYIKK